MLRFFISSTFKDMMKERETLHTKVYPKLREYGLNNGVNVDLCDLRWGIYLDEKLSEEQLTKEIMGVCFGEIVNCNPHLIAIIGDEYGTIAKNNKVIHELWNAYERGDLPADTNISLTQWELEFSFLSQTNPDVKVLCLIKESPENKKAEDARVNLLKERIIKKQKQYPEKITLTNYSNTDELSLSLNEYITKIIDKERASFSENWKSRELTMAEALAHEKNATFSGRQDELNLCIDKIKNSDNMLLGIYGEVGVGKTSLLSYLFHKIKELDIRSHIVFCGQTELTSHYKNILLLMIDILSREIESNYRMEMKEDDLESKIELYLKNLLDKYEETAYTEKLIFIIDAIDKLESARDSQLLDRLMLYRGKKVKFVFSRTVEYSEKYGMDTVELKLLNKKDIGLLSRMALFSQAQKIDTENNEIIQKILETKLSNSPIFLKFMITILKNELSSIKGDRHTIIKKIEDLPQSIEELGWQALISSIEYLIENNAQIDSDNMLLGLAFIAVSEHGLLEKNIEELLSLMNGKWSSLEFVLLKQYLNYFFTQHDNGRWMYTNSIIKTAIEKNYYQNSKTGLDLRYVMLQYVKQSRDIEIKIKEGLKLCVLFQDYKTSLMILELISKSDISLRRMAAKELARLLNEPRTLDWYKHIISEHPLDLLLTLTSLIINCSVEEDYERRIPAKWLVDLFWTYYNIGVVEERSFEEQYACAELCVEYLDIYESIGKHLKVHTYVKYPINFFYGHLASYTKEEKQKAYKHLNSVLYINNKMISQLKRDSNQTALKTELIRYSETIEQGFLRDYFGFNQNCESDVSYPLRGFYERYLSNIGQYYNAVERYDIALKYHFLSLKSKAYTFLSLFTGKTKKDLGISISNLFGYNESNLNLYQLLGLDLSEHMNLWRGIEAEFSNKMKEQLRLIGVSYRTIASDCYFLEGQDNLSELKVKKESIINFGCTCIDIAYAILDLPEVQASEREVFVTFVRKLGLYCKKKSMDKGLYTHLLEMSREKVNQFEINANHFGKEEGKYLQGNLNKLAPMLKQEGMDKALLDLEVLLDDLNRVLGYKSKE